MQRGLLFLALLGLIGITSAQISRSVGMHIFGGHQQVEDITLGECLNLCSEEPLCLGLDYNFADKECWFHGADSVCDRMYEKDQCVHYSFVSCPLTGTPNGVTRLDGMHLFNGVRQPGISSLESCLQQCSVKSEACQGIDFDMNPDPETGEYNPECWLHDSHSECTIPGNKESCTHYSFVDCEISTTEAPATQPPAATTTETASSINTIPDLANFERISDSHIKHGYLRKGITSVSECLEICWWDMYCQGFDFNEGSNQCWTHGKDTECDSLLSKPTCSHYRLRANCVSEGLRGCSAIGYTVAVDANRELGGDQVAMASSPEDCQAMCTMRYDCVGAKYEKYNGYCTLFNTTGLTMGDTCCTYATKFCADQTTTHAGQTRTPHSYTTTPATSSPAMITTTQASFLSNPTTVPDGGSCPTDVYATYPNSQMSGGALKSGVTSEEECKIACQDEGTACAALVWDGNNNECFHHATLDLAAYQPGQLGYTHYRKLNCQETTCYNHGSIDVTAMLFDFFAAATPGVTLDSVTARLNVLTSEWEPPSVSCPGSCYTAITFQPSASGSNEPNIIDSSVPLLIERGCNIAPRASQKNCLRQTVDATLDYQRMTCNCYGDLCNAFGLLLNDCAGYYPLDASAEDFSFALRDGLDINIEYDAFHVQKNWSAIFSGDSRIKIPSFSNFLWGSVNPNNDNKSPAFTVTMWLNRLGTSNTMYIMSNGDSFNIFSDPDGTNLNHFIKWQVSINNTEYTTQTPTIPMNQWSWLAFVISDSQETYHMNIYVDDPVTPVVEFDTEVMVDITGPGVSIDTQVRPLCLGDRSVDYNQVNAEDPVVSPFIGFMDEVWLFTKAVSALPVVKEVSTGPMQVTP